MEKLVGRFRIPQARIAEDIGELMASLSNYGFEVNRRISERRIEYFIGGPAPKTSKIPFFITPNGEASTVGYILKTEEGEKLTLRNYECDSLPGDVIDASAPTD